MIRSRSRVHIHTHMLIDPAPCPLQHPSYRNVVRNVVLIGADRQKGVKKRKRVSSTPVWMWVTHRSIRALWPLAFINNSSFSSANRSKVTQIKSVKMAKYPVQYRGVCPRVCDLLATRATLPMALAHLLSQLSTLLSMNTLSVCVHTSSMCMYGYML